MTDQPFKHKEYSVGMNIPNSPETGRLKELMEETTRRMASDLNRSLYAPNPLLDHLTRDYEPPTRCGRLVSRFKEAIRRTHDAWLVLTGKADIE